MGLIITVFVISIIFIAIGTSIKVTDTDSGFKRFLKNLLKLIFIIFGIFLLIIIISSILNGGTL